MIARIWRGAVERKDREAYAEYMQGTGISGYASTSGNQGVWMLCRDRGDRTEFAMFTLWDSMEAIEAFAGDDPEAAVFYAEDDEFLVERETVVAHYEVHTYRGPRPVVGG